MTSGSDDVTRGLVCGAVEFGVGLAGGQGCAPALALLCEYAQAALAVDGVGIVTGADAAAPTVVGSPARLDPVFEALGVAGPALSCMLTGVAWCESDRGFPGEAGWEGFVGVRRAHGLHSTFAVPVRGRHRTLGALCAFIGSSQVNPNILPLALRMADLASLVLSWTTAEDEVAAESERLRQAKEAALAIGTSVLIEQAKGVVAERFGVDLERAGELLTAYAAARRVGVADIARRALENRLDLPIAHADPRLTSLSPVEARILSMIQSGATNRQIADELKVAEKTVKNRVTSILAKLGLSSRTQAAVYASRFHAGGPGS